MFCLSLDCCALCSLSVLRVSGISKCLEIGIANVPAISLFAVTLQGSQIVHAPYGLPWLCKLRFFQVPQHSDISLIE